MGDSHGRRSKKIRSRDLENIRQKVTALVEAEERKDKKKILEITDEELAAAASERVIDTAHWRPFMLWYMTRESPTGIGWMEAYHAPAAYADDTLFFLGLIADEREMYKAKNKKRANAD